MSFALDPAARTQKEVRRVARERIDEALRRLDIVPGATPGEIEDAVHSVRKRCKEARALARLVRGSIGGDYARFNSRVRDAASELSSIRDAHAVLATLDHLRVAQHHEHDDDVNRVRAGQSELAARATLGLREGDPRLVRATELLIAARRGVRRWEIPTGSDWLSAGIGDTYRRGRRDLRRAIDEPSDHRVHEWRKSVKRLWYQLRLVEAGAPSTIRPLVDQLDCLAEALGDDHDLAVLVERIASDPAADKAIELARLQQRELRRRAFRLGRSIYAEAPAGFVGRITAYWELAQSAGPELTTGGVARLTADRSEPAESVERERKFLVDLPPPLRTTGTVFRQGYLAVDGMIEVRVRDAAEEGCTLTVKAGRGPVRTEMEWPISGEQFDIVWEHTAGRRVHKTRHRVPLGESGDAAELDIFHDDLSGLVVVEVEFASDAELSAFEPPLWFGQEVTGQEAYTNAVLAVRGCP